jgi:3,4-dihydroxy 2-butanone 4-phosphate synthase/GTP cyclohydrolase II
MPDLSAAVAAMSSGSLVVLVGDEARRQDSALVTSGAHATAAGIAFPVRHTSGFVSVAMSAERARQLNLPALGTLAGSSAQPCVSVDAAETISTGISAADRAHTIRLLASAAASPTDFCRPGHVVPVRAARAIDTRWTEADAAAELAERAGSMAAAFAAITSTDDPTAMASAREARAFANQHGLAAISLAEVAAAARSAHSVQQRRLVFTGAGSAGRWSPGSRVRGRRA